MKVKRLIYKRKGHIDKRLGLTIIDWYIIRKFLGTFFFSLALCTLSFFCLANSDAIFSLNHPWRKNRAVGPTVGLNGPFPKL